MKRAKRRQQITILYIYVSTYSPTVGYIISLYWIECAWLSAAATRLRVLLYGSCTVLYSNHWLMGKDVRYNYKLVNWRMETMFFFENNIRFFFFCLVLQHECIVWRMIRGFIFRSRRYRRNYFIIYLSNEHGLRYKNIII